MDKGPDGWHMMPNDYIDQLVVRHIARASDYAYSLCYMRAASEVEEVDGDPFLSFDREEPTVAWSSS